MTDTITVTSITHSVSVASPGPQGATGATGATGAAGAMPPSLLLQASANMNQSISAATRALGGPASGLLTASDIDVAPMLHYTASLVDLAGYTTQLRLVIHWATPATAPGCDFTFALTAFTTGSAGSGSTIPATFGSNVSGSTVTITPGAGTTGTSNSGWFTPPSNGPHLITTTNSGTTAASSAFMFTAQLQAKYTAS